MAGEDVSMQDVTDQGEKEEPRVIDVCDICLLGTRRDGV
jgi:hypothetical protein